MALTLHLFHNRYCTVIVCLLPTLKAEQVLYTSTQTPLVSLLIPSLSNPNDGQDKNPRPIRSPSPTALQTFLFSSSNTKKSNNRMSVALTTKP